MKRFVAIILTICLLLTLFVPAVFAVGTVTSEETVVATYNFDMKSNTDPAISQYKWDETTRKINKPVKLADGTIDTTYSHYIDLIKALYKNNTLNWGIHTSLTNTVFDHEGICTVANNATGGYMGFRLKAPTTEETTYLVSLNVTYVRDQANIYLLESSAKLPADMTEENLLFDGTVATKGVHTDTVTLSGGEYILVVDHVVPDGETKRQFAFSELTLAITGDGGSEETTAPAETTAPDQTTASDQTTAPEQTTVPEQTTAPEQTTVPKESAVPGELPAPGTVMATYNFDMKSSTDPMIIPYKWTDSTRKINKTVLLTDGTVDSTYSNYRLLINALYADPNCSLNWGIHKTLDNSSFGDNGIRTVATEKYGKLMSFWLDAPRTQAVEYEISLKVTRAYDHANIYLLEADGDLNTDLTEENLLFGGTVTNAGEYTDTVTLSGDKYILVIDHVFVEGNTKGLQFSIGEMTLSIPGGEGPEETTAPEVKPGTYVEGVYNFALFNEDARKSMFTTAAGKLTYRTYNQTCYHCGESIEKCLAAQYKADELNWVLEGTTFGELNFKGDYYASNQYGGLHMRYNTDENGNKIPDPNDPKKYTEAVGLMVAFRVKVANPGTYTVTADKDYPYACTADMYILPAPETTMTGSELAAAANEANCVGRMKVTTDIHTAQIADYNFETAGEYIIILKASSKRIYLNTITLTVPKVPQPIPAVNEKLYDFNLGAIDEKLLKKAMTSTYSKAEVLSVRKVLNNMYDADQTFWKYETASETFKSTVCSFRTGYLRFKSTENFRDLKEQWIAFRIKNPGTATYDIRLVSSGGKSVANVYLIPAASLTVMENADIKAAMTSENLLVKGAIFDKKETFYLGEYTFGMEEEYVLVFEFTKGMTLYLKELKMTLDGKVADGTVKKEKVYNGTVYDFDLADPLNGYFSKSKVNLRDVLGDVNSMWNSGVLNWKWETSSEGLRGKTAETMYQPGTLTRFYSSGGLRALCPVDNWNAFRIKSPGSGTFTLSLNYATETNGGTMAVYILPGDTEDIEFAMDPKNRVGKVALYHDDGGALKDGKSTYLGYFDFEAGKEYIVVFEGYTESPNYAGYCYMNASQLIAERGKIDFELSEADKQVKAVTVHEKVVRVADAWSQCLITEVYGHDYYILPMEGKNILVYDVDTEELIDNVANGFVQPTGLAQDQDGVVWVCGSSRYLVWYDPYTQTSGKTAEFADDWRGDSIIAGPDGKIYFTAGKNLVSYDKETKIFTTEAEIMPDGVMCKGILYHDGYLYMTPYNDDKQIVVKYDFNSKKIVTTTDVSHKMGDSGYLESISMLGDGDLLVFGDNSGLLKEFIAVDPNTMELVETGLWAGMSLGASEEVDGKHYLVVTGYGLYEYDIATKTISKTPGFGTEGFGFRSEGKSLVTIDGEKCLMTFAKGGHPRFFNLDTKEFISWDNLVVHGSGGADIRSIAVGTGKNELYMGLYNYHSCAVYNTELGVKTGEFLTGGQTDSAIFYKGKLYNGNYSSTTLNEIVLDGYDYSTMPSNNEYMRRWKLDHEETGQKRVHTLAAGDDRIFAGTIPDTGEFGGAVVVYDTTSGQWYYERNVVQDQAVTGLAYQSGLLYGATSRSGGTQSSLKPPENTSAKLFVYDYENRKVLATLDPRDYLDGFTDRVEFVAGLAADPVVENRVWAVVSETLFCFTFDRETLTFNVQEVISFGRNEYDSSSNRSIFCRPILFDTDRNQFYFSFDLGGGFQCIEMADWNAHIGSIKVVNNQRIMSDRPLTYVLGEDGNLYYGKNADLKMLPMNVTDEDWAIAGEVDQMITDLGEITLESESAVKTARSAYDNLSWRYRALIQKLELLRESETDLLECQIDAIVLEEIAADSITWMQGLMDTYKGMNSRQQKYVKNYGKFKEAYNKASNLNDQRIAAALQKRIDLLKDKFPLTLDDEPEVVQLRTDYDLLTGTQRALMDITILEDAEAQIKVLRSEFVKYVETLIQAIPEEITLDADEVITKASEAADKLYVNERKQISYSKLTSAESKLRALKNAKAAADEVDALIKEIGIVTLGDKARIAAAREAYDALNKTALGFVTKTKKLESAEFILKALQTWGIPVIVILDAAIIFAVIWFIPSLHSKVFKTKKKEEVIDN